MNSVISSLQNLVSTLRPIQWVLSVLIIIALAVLGFFAIGERSNSSSKTETPIIWSPYTEPFREEEGYLALLSSKESQARAYISIDTPVDSGSFEITPGWTIDVVATGTQWNPRICAKTPSVITPDGDIYMVDAQRTKDGYDTYLIWFDGLNTTLKQVKLPHGEFVGKTLFTDSANRPYFFIQIADTLFVSHIDTTRSVLEQQPLLQLNENDSVTVTPMNGHVPLIEQYSGANLSSQTFTLQNGILEEINSASTLEQVEYPDEVHSIHTVGGGFEATYSLEDPYATTVSLNDNFVVGFVPEKEVYSYVVGGFASPQ